MEKFDLRNRRRIKEKQGEEEAERAVEPAGVMRDRRVRRKMRKTKTKQKFTTTVRLAAGAAVALGLVNVLAHQNIQIHEHEICKAQIHSPG